MKQIPSYGDERILAFCTFCGGETGTRDHCPSRIFLDEPYPDNLPVVPACSTCNTSFSSDEEYLACLVCCVIAGSTDPDVMPREKVKRILIEKPQLRARIEQAHLVSDGKTIFKPEFDRITSVITKLAQGHALFELHEACTHIPNEINTTPLMIMGKARREAFEIPDASNIWPEVGSRMMQRLITGIDLAKYGWIIVQPERYRYHASVSNGVEVRIVIHEYLACQVRWEF